MSRKRNERRPAPPETDGERREKVWIFAADAISHMYPGDPEKLAFEILRTIDEFVREAEEAERERVARLAAELDATYKTEVPNPDPPGGWIVTHHSFADRVREGK